jgi:hypothetical protein
MNEKVRYDRSWRSQCKARMNVDRYLTNRHILRIVLSLNFSRIRTKVARFEVFTAVTMENAVFWDIKPQFLPHWRHITSLLQSPVG